eukprot:GHVT01007536.1.p1 GENE.GHVT01007536.1~~GHVT01007536.1.p1  ORF type:complete len:172 (+),score=29.93 GHVT01007536.1:2189-2704(+)
MFAGLIFASAISAIFIDKVWFARIHWALKVPLYSINGVSLSFLLAFCLVDGLTLWHAHAQAAGGNRWHQPLVHNAKQLCAIIIGSFVEGLTFGFFYGFFDLEDDTGAKSVRLMQQRLIALPLAVAIGTSTGFAVESLGRRPEAKVYGGAAPRASRPPYPRDDVRRPGAARR